MTLMRFGQPQLLMSEADNALWSLRIEFRWPLVCKKVSTAEQIYRKRVYGERVLAGRLLLSKITLNRLTLPEEGNYESGQERGTVRALLPRPTSS